MRDGRHWFQQTSCAEELEVSACDASTVGVPTGARVLIVAAGARVCALSVHHVAETMRPLPVEPVAGTPHYVRGLSVIRGASVPVVDLPALLDSCASGTSATRRFVTVKADARLIALAVDSVIGIRELDATQLEELPPLLRHADVALIEAIGVADAQLLVVLRGARILPEETWKAIEAGTVTR